MLLIMINYECNQRGIKGFKFIVVFMLDTQTNMYLSLCMRQDYPLKGVTLLCYTYRHVILLYYTS